VSGQDVLAPYPTGKSGLVLAGFVFVAGGRQRQWQDNAVV